MSKKYWKCTLISGQGGHVFGEHDITIYTEKIDDQYPDAEFIESVVNQRFVNPDGGPYEFRTAITIDLTDDQIQRLNANPNIIV